MYLTEPLKLTIDIDGVLVNNFVIWKEYFNSKYVEHNHPYKIKAQDSPHWDYFTEICKKCWNHVLHDKEMVSSYELVEGALDVLGFLKQIGFDLYILTSRPKDVTDTTKQWVVDKFGLLVTDTFVTDDKVTACHEVGAKYHVDDAPKHIIKFQEQDKTKIIIWDHPYNQTYKGPRVATWPQYGAYLLWDHHK